MIASLEAINFPFKPANFRSSYNWKLKKFDAYVDIADIPHLEIGNVVSDDSSPSSSSPNSPISPRTGYIPRSTNKEVYRENSNSNSTTLEARDYSTFQSHVRSVISTQKFGTSDLLMNSWQHSTHPSDITLVVFMDCLTYSFKLVPTLTYSTINGHRSMLNRLLHLNNPVSLMIPLLLDQCSPRFTYSPLLHKTLVLCKMFGLARSDLVKWSLNNLIVSTDSTKDDDNSSVCPVRLLKSSLFAASKRSTNSGNSVFIQNNGDPLSTKEINEIVVSTLSKSGIDISKFKSHSTRSATASLLLSNNIPFHVVKKMGRWKSNDAVDTFYYMEIIGEKSGGLLNYKKTIHHQY
ncbi:hypothetical protein ACTA71_006579 [Dictyostelium dimigraforme]